MPVPVNGGQGWAGQLSGKGYDVVVVDSRRDAFRKLPEDFNGNQVEGDVTDPKVLGAVRSRKGRGVHCSHPE